MKFNRQLDQFAPYRTFDTEGKILMNKNESPFDIPGEIKEQMIDRWKAIPFNRYPPIESLPLRRKVSEKTGVEEGMIIAGCGSDALISDLMHLFEGEYIVTFTPTFSMYGFYAKRRGLKVVEIPLNDAFDIPETLDEEIIARAHSVFIANPNNPTGKLYDDYKIDKILRIGVPVVLDEAYWEFSGKTSLAKLREFENLIILRTFSKAMGLSGLRIGLGFAGKKLMEKWFALKSPYNLNTLSEIAAIEMLEHPETLERNIAFIIRERQRIYKAFREIATESFTNFLLLQADAFDFLYNNGILVQKFRGRLEKHIRVTVGTEYENDRLIRKLEAFLKA